MRLGFKCGEGERGRDQGSSSLTFELRWLSRPLRSLLRSCATDSAVCAVSAPESVFRLRFGYHDSRFVGWPSRVTACSELR